MATGTAKLIASRPVLLNELKRIARNRRVHILRIVYLLAFLSGALMLSRGVRMYPYYRTIEEQVAQMGKTLFYLYVVCQSIGLGIVAPALSAGVFSREKENQTFELLLTTDLGPSEILWHKVISHILALTLLTAAAVPIFFLCMMFGGISAGEILAYMGFAAGGLLLCCGAAAFFSSILRTTGGSILASYGFIWAVVCFGPLLLGLICDAVDICYEDHIFEACAYVDIVWCYVAFIDGPSSPGSIWKWISSGAFTGAFFVVAMVLSSRLAPRSIEWKPRRLFTRVMSALDRFYGSFRLGQVVLFRARAPIGNNPILWRECHTNVFGRRAYFIRIALVLYILAGCLALLDPNFFVDNGAQRVVLCLEYVVLAVILVACGSATIAKERQGRTLGLLLSTPLDPWNILLGKIAGVLRRAFLVLLLMVGHIFVLEHLDVLSGEECLYCLANALVFGAFFLAIAMASSAYWKSTSRATLGALFISFGILIVPAIVCVVLEIGFGPGAVRDMDDFVLAFSPGYWIVAMMQRHGRPETFWYVMALVLYSAVAFVLFSICGRRFRKLAAEG